MQSPSAPAKTVLITGASAGIGKATAKLFAARGWQVAATLRNPQREAELALISNIKLYELDVSLEETAIHGRVHQIIQDLGAIDVLVNNAGIGIFGTFELATPEQIQQQFEVNVFGLMRVTRAVLPHFRKRGCGIVLNVTSGAGKIGLPLESLYSATKFAVEGFSESLQYELKRHGVRVKLVEPGNTQTNFFTTLQVIDHQNVRLYRRYQERMLAKHRELNRRGCSVETVAQAIYKAANDPSNRLRYPAGRQIAFFLLLRKLLPDPLVFWLVRGQFERSFD